MQRDYFQQHWRSDCLLYCAISPVNLVPMLFSLCSSLDFQYPLLRCVHRQHRIEINRKATRVGTFEVCVSTHVSLRMFIMQVLASQLPFLANRNAELAVPALFWPVNCIKIGGHVALLSGATVYSYTVPPVVLGAKSANLDM